MDKILKIRIEELKRAFLYHITERHRKQVSTADRKAQWDSFWSCIKETDATIETTAPARSLKDD